VSSRPKLLGVGLLLSGILVCGCFGTFQSSATPQVNEAAVALQHVIEEMKALNDPKLANVLEAIGNAATALDKPAAEYPPWYVTLFETLGPLLGGLLGGGGAGLLGASAGVKRGLRKNGIIATPS